MSEGLKLLRSVCEQKTIEVLRTLSGELFVGEDEKEAFRYIRQHYRRYSELPSPDTVHTDCGVRLPRAPEQSQYYYDRCYDRRMFLSVRDPFNELRQALMDNAADKARDTIIHMARNIHRYDSAQDLLTMGDMNEQLLEQLKHAQMMDDMSGISTGWPTIDEVTGGYQNGDLDFYVARPKVGKTHVMIHSARHAWLSGRKVLIVSMEMTLKQVAQRFYAHHTGLDPDKMKKGQVSSYTMKRMREIMATLVDDDRLRLFAGNFKGKATMEVDAIIQEVQPDIIFVDGFYLLKPVDAPRNVGRIEKVGYITDELKQIALERARPIVCSTQFARGGGGKKGAKDADFDAIGFSDAINQHASLAFSVKMPSWDKNERPDSRVIETMASREGEHCKIAINFKFAPVDFSEGDEHLQDKLKAADSKNETIDTDFMDAT